MEHPLSLNSWRFNAYLASQFFGAVNDNAFKVVIALLAIKVIVNPAHASQLIGLGGALFLLPLILFSSYTGNLADRLSKKQVMVWAKFMEIVLMLLAFLALTRQDMVLLLLILAGMGARASLFSPSKYGILPEMVSDGDLSRANGLLQLWTSTGIILGTALIGSLMGWVNGRMDMAGIFLMAVAGLGLFTSLFIPDMPAADPGRPFEINFLKDLTRTFIEVRKNRPLYFSIMGVMYFWMAGALFEMNLLLYAEESLVLTEAATSYLLAALGIGIGLGGFSAGMLSGRKVEPGLVPLGALGMGASSFLLSFSCTASSPASPLVTGSLLFLLGASGGLFVIPLTASIQRLSPGESLGRILGLEHFLSFSGILSSAVIFFLVTQVLGLDTPAVFVLLGVSPLVVVSLFIVLYPDFLIRSLAWLLAHSVYRCRIIGNEHIPSPGKGILVRTGCPSALDAFLITACIQDPVSFFIQRACFQTWPLSPRYHLMRVTRVEGDNPLPALLHSLSAATRGAQKGELVCLFYEGGTTGADRVLPHAHTESSNGRGNALSVVPVHLERAKGGFPGFRTPVAIVFGAPLRELSIGVVDPDTMQDLAPGKKGLLLLKDAGITTGQAGEEQGIVGTGNDGWRVTGFGAVTDEKGGIRIMNHEDVTTIKSKGRHSFMGHPKKRKEKSDEKRSALTP
ncbi:MAG: MFS transporter [bacterium]